MLLYASGLSMNRTAKLLGVSTLTIQAWLEQFAATYAQKPEPEGRAVMIELDEMWRYLKKRKSRTVLDLNRSCSHPERLGRYTLPSADLRNTRHHPIPAMTACWLCRADASCSSSSLIVVKAV